MIYLKLLWAFLQVGLFSIGGGYAALLLIQNQVVEINTWLTLTEFADVLTISQMTPGPISLNAATFVGTRVGGVLGAIVATLGCILPSWVIVLTLAVLYKKYRNLKYVQGVLKSLHPAVVGMIASAAFSIIALSLWNTGKVSFNINDINFIALTLVAVCLLMLRKTKINPTVIMIGAGVVGGLIYSFI